jgi:O-antigen/teichoic acid export membrane protein
MGSRLIWRRSATAIGAYSAAGLGLASTIVATRELGLDAYARFAAVVAAMAFFQQLLDLTIEEALVKYGFRYIEAKRWGRLRRLFEVALGFKLLGGVLAAVLLAALAPFAKSVWGAGGVFVPMLIAATITVAQAPENVAASAIILRGRYDIRGAFLAVSMALRLLGIAVGSIFGLDWAVLGMAVAQVVSTAAISIAGIAAFRRFPQEASERLGDDIPGLRRFFFASTFSSSLDSARGTLGTSLVPTVAPIVQAGFFDNALAPDTGFAAISAPVRMILLTEQTRDFEAGRFDLVARMLRRYVAVSSLLMLVAVPVFWVLMPFLMGLAYGTPYRLHATAAARLILVAAALRLIWGWTKSFPVSIGRPGLRVVVQAIEIAVFIPLLLVLASRDGATGAAWAVLVSTIVFCATWSIVLLRLRSGWRTTGVVPN